MFDPQKSPQSNGVAPEDRLETPTTPGASGFRRRFLRILARSGLTPGSGIPPDPKLLKKLVHSANRAWAAEGIDTEPITRPLDPPILFLDHKSPSGINLLREAPALRVIPNKKDGTWNGLASKLPRGFPDLSLWYDPLTLHLGSASAALRSEGSTQQMILPIDAVPSRSPNADHRDLLRHELVHATNRKEVIPPVNGLHPPSSARRAPASVLSKRVFAFFQESAYPFHQQVRWSKQPYLASYSFDEVAAHATQNDQHSSDSDSMMGTDLRALALSLEIMANIETAIKAIQEDRAPLFTSDRIGPEVTVLPFFLTRIRAVGGNFYSFDMYGSFVFNKHPGEDLTEHGAIETLETLYAEQKSLSRLLYRRILTHSGVSPYQEEEFDIKYRGLLFEFGITGTQSTPPSGEAIADTSASEFIRIHLENYEKHQDPSTLAGVLFVAEEGLEELDLVTIQKILALALQSEEPSLINLALSVASKREEAIPGVSRVARFLSQHQSWSQSTLVEFFASPSVQGKSSHLRRLALKAAEDLFGDTWIPYAFRGSIAMTEERLKKAGKYFAESWIRVRREGFSQDKERMYSLLFLVDEWATFLKVVGKEEASAHAWSIAMELRDSLFSI